MGMSRCASAGAARERMDFDHHGFGDHRRTEEIHDRGPAAGVGASALLYDRHTEARRRRQRERCRSGPSERQPHLAGRRTASTPTPRSASSFKSLMELQPGKAAEAAHRCCRRKGTRFELLARTACGAWPRVLPNGPARAARLLSPATLASKLRGVPSAFGRISWPPSPCTVSVSSTRLRRPLRGLATHAANIEGNCGRCGWEPVNRSRDQAAPPACAPAPATGAKRLGQVFRSGRICA
jgi:hypothetical protein